MYPYGYMDGCMNIYIYIYIYIYISNDGYIKGWMNR